MNIDVKWPKKYCDVPFVEKGRDWNGADCWGLYYLIMQGEHGIEVPKFLEYDATQKEDAIKIAQLIDKYCDEEWDLIPFGAKIKPFDILVLIVSGRPWHIGIVIDKCHFIHTLERTNVTIERFDRHHWQRRIKQIRRHHSQLQA